MLETEEVDIDYFTPAGSTSLASIFGKSSVGDETKDNPSLKYVPPPPPEKSEKSKLEDVKPTQWIFTCAIHGFEWINSRYVSRGKMGFAILKVIKTNSHSIILYDSNKTTVSCVTVSPRLNIHIRDVLTISYYDNAQKYWSIKTSDEDMNKILQLLKDCQATIVPKSVDETDKEQSSSTGMDNKNITKDVLGIKNEEQKEELDSDTVFCVNQKKDSILKRMANMGHSVLPPHGSPKGYSSDSSGSNDKDSKKNIKLKPAKVTSKKCTDLCIEQGDGNVAPHSRKSAQRNSASPCGADISIFISEQKISNSELRINVNRVSDKLDIILERLHDAINIDKSNSFSNFQNDIVQKLIREYESKIRYYECVMDSKGIDYNTMKSSDKRELNENVTNSHNNDTENMKKIDELETLCKEKNNIIKKLEKEISVLKDDNTKISQDSKKRLDELVLEIKSLNANLNLKNEEIETLKNNLSSLNATNHESSDIANKVKKIMNDTFEAISVNFDDNEDYNGERIKAVIAIVIKKTTIKALEEL